MSCQTCLSFTITFTPRTTLCRVRKIWRKRGARLSEIPRLSLLVAEADGVLVGSCFLAMIPNLTRGARPYGLIENVVTHAGYRKQGIGTGLLRRALKIAWGQDCYKVMLLIGLKREETLVKEVFEAIRAGLPQFDYREGQETIDEDYVPHVVKDRVYRLNDGKVLRSDTTMTAWRWLPGVRSSSTSQGSNGILTTSHGLKTLTAHVFKMVGKALKSRAAEC